MVLCVFDVLVSRLSRPHKETFVPIGNLYGHLCSVICRFIHHALKGHCTYQCENDDKCDGREEDACANGHDGYIGCYLHSELP